MTFWLLRRCRFRLPAELTALLASGLHLPDKAGGEVAFVDQDYTSEKPAAAAREHSIELAVVKLPQVKCSFVLLARRWVVERSFAWVTRFRRLVKDCEHYASTAADFHPVAFVCLMLRPPLNSPKAPDSL